MYDDDEVFYIPAQEKLLIVRPRCALSSAEPGGFGLPCRSICEDVVKARS